ncbi:MAG: YfdX family protein [Nitrospirales bacterium]
MKYLFCEFTLIGVLLTSSLSPSWGWDGHIRKDIDHTEDKILCLQPATMPPSTAAKVLCAIARARESLHHKTFAQATNDLHHARTLIDLIKFAGPTTRVKDQLWEVKKNWDSESSEKLALDLIPIDLRLTNLEFFVPVVEAKAHLHAAYKSLHNQDRASAINHLEALINALIHTEGALRLTATEHHIVQAQKLLTHNKIQQADAVLGNAEEGAEFISLRVDVISMAQARKNLWPGMGTYPVPNVHSEKNAPKQAEVWLTRHVQVPDEKIQEEKTALPGMVATLTEEDEQKGLVVTPVLQGLWQKTTTPTADKQTQTGDNGQTFRKHNTTNLPLQSVMQLKTDLMEAKFYLTYTEIFELITHEDYKAQTAIEKAQMHLMSAEKLADGWLKGNIQAIEQESDLIHKELMNDQQSNMIRYAKLKTDVQQLLQELSW